jgi:ElaB/YqjD/DUF883 family membrane-anchored ribosome-binding protein
MDSKSNKDEGRKQETAKEEPGSAGAAAQKIIERGAKIYGQVEQSVTGAYDKTTGAVKDTYDRARTYSSENPGKTILISLGAGVGLGLLLGVGARTLRMKHIRDHLTSEAR